jgi:hypothetical protein
MDYLEKKMITNGIVVNKAEEGEESKHMVSPEQTDTNLTPANITFQKARGNKTKRFKSTNARYKHVSSKMERSQSSLLHLRKWSQGKSFIF